MQHSPVNFRLSNLISIYISNEMVIEIIRKELSSISFFDSNLAFNRIDQQRLGYINARQLNNFLLENKIPSLMSDCELLVKFFDMDEDGVLSFLEFCSVILPATTNSRDQVVINSKYNDFYPGERLNPIIESTLSRLIDAEISAQLQIENAKKYLSDKFDFNASLCFQTLTLYNINYITADALSIFMKKMGSPKSNSEIFAFIRRTDKDNDAKLSYSEFYDAVTPLREIPTIKRSHSFRRSVEVPLSPIERPINYYYVTPVKRTLSPGRIIQTDFDPNISNEKVTYVSPNRVVYYESPRIYPLSLSPSKTKEEIGIVKALNEINRYDVYLNDDIKHLIYKPDFDIIALFKLFDRDNKGYILFEDLRAGLNELGLSPTTEEQVLFFKKFDLNNDNRISYTEFCEVFTIKSNNSYLTPIQIYSNPTSLYFSVDTRNTIKSVLSKFISNEAIIESIKRNLFSQYYLNTKEAFDICDLKGLGFITKDVFRELLGISMYPNLDIIFSRFDKDRDGRISLKEFSEEISPNKIITV